MKGTNKFNSQKYKGCDSKKEYKRLLELQELERQGKIMALQQQVEYELIPSQRLNGKVIERAIKYRADFQYIENGELVVEDVKGYKKGAAYAVFVIKRKLMLWTYGIRVKET